MTCTVTCPGKCCAVFYLSDHHDEVSSMVGRVVDGEMIADMVIPLDTEAAVARAERFGVARARSYADLDGHLYTCRHWDEDTHLCRVYEKRPEMCRDYPYDQACDHGCAYTAPPDVRTTYRVRHLYRAFGEWGRARGWAA